MDLHDVAPELDKWVDDHCIITKADRVEATLNGEAMYAEVVEKKLLELAQERSVLKTDRHELSDLLAQAHDYLKSAEKGCCHEASKYHKFIKNVETALGV